MKTNAQFKAVMEMNLDAIKAKLMHVASGEGWSQDKANAVEKEYRRFLCLMQKYPNENTAPVVDVDTFWHYHILDTMKYAVDCEQAFGYFLHHYPYVGMGGEEDEQVRLDAGDRLRELYEATFGEAYPVLHADGVHAVAPAHCGAAANDGSAHCGAAANDGTAHCGAAVKAHTSHCGAAVKTYTAHCGAAVKLHTAHCGAAANDGTAHCGAAVKATTAHCGAAVKAHTAHCGAAANDGIAHCGAAIAPAIGKFRAEASLAA